MNLHNVLRFLVKSMTYLRTCEHHDNGCTFVFMIYIYDLAIGFVALMISNLIIDTNLLDYCRIELYNVIQSEKLAKSLTG